MPESTVCASFGPTRLARSSSSKAALLRRAGEAEELERALARVGVDAQRHRLALVGQRGVGGERDEHLVADAAHVDHDARRRALEQHALEPRDHDTRLTRTHGPPRGRAAARARPRSAAAPPSGPPARVAERGGERVGGVGGRAALASPSRRATMRWT